MLQFYRLFVFGGRFFYLIFGYVGINDKEVIVICEVVIIKLNFILFLNVDWFVNLINVVLVDIVNILVVRINIINYLESFISK